MPLKPTTAKGSSPNCHMNTMNFVKDTT